MAGAAAPKPPALGGAPPPRPRAPAAPVGLAGPAPGGAPPMGGGGLGGSGGFAKGGKAEKLNGPPGEGRFHRMHGKRFAKGGVVSGEDSKKRVGRDTGRAEKGD